MLTTFVVYLENIPGALNRVASLFRRRGFNIESLTVGQTEKPKVSRMTIAINTDEFGAHRVEANLYKLVNVLKVENITAVPSVFRDLAMFKVSADNESRTQIMRLVDAFRAKIVDVTTDSVIIETTGTEDKIEALFSVLRSYGVLEMVRTGRVAMTRGVTPKIANGSTSTKKTRGDDSISHSV